MGKQTALSLFDKGSLKETTESGIIFTSSTEPVTNKNGVIVGSKTVVKLAKASDARDRLQLKGKANQDEWTEEQRKAKVLAFRKLKAHLLTLDETRLGLIRFQEKTGADGLLDMSFRIKEQPQKPTLLTPEQVAKAWGISLAEAMEKLSAAGLTPRGTVEVQSEVVPAKAISEGTQETANEAANTEKQAGE